LVPAEIQTAYVPNAAEALQLFHPQGDRFSVSFRVPDHSLQAANLQYMVAPINISRFDIDQETFSISINP